MAGPGYLFSLSDEFFATLDCVSDGTTPTVTEAGSSRTADSNEEETPSNPRAAEGWSEGMGATCIACGIGVNSQGFTSSVEQRQHFKTDWHRYNVKRRLEKKPPVTEAVFEAMIEQQDDVSSISGSDTDDSSSDSDISEDESAEGQPSASSRTSKGQGSSTIVQGAQVVFQTHGGDAFAVWRCLLLPDSHKHRQEQQNQQQLLALLRQLRGSVGSSSSSRVDAASSSSSNGGSTAAAAAAAGPKDGAGCVWAIFMLRGGHFAGAVVKMNSSNGRGSSSSSRKAGSNVQTVQQQPAEQADGGSSSQASSRQTADRAQAGFPQGCEPFTVLAHKTFHRYVVRAKAGGKQSTKDATGKFARSAGSRLRRYNEAALSRDITQLVKDWSHWLNAAGLIFVAAPGSNGRVLFDAAAEAAPPSRQGSAGPLDPADLRVRRVPFVTQRPTFSELKRALWVLASVRKVTLSAAAQQEEDATAGGEQQDTQQQAKQQAKQQEAVIAAGAATAVVPPMPAAKKQEEPPLIKASKAGDAERVSRLLANGHDPTVRDTRGRSPYQLAASKEVRDAFRRFMAAAPDAWDYSSSDIPSPLTDELEAAQQSKKEEPPLIKASKAGDAERVSRLLANGHDPTVRDTRGRSPYQLAASKEVRDAFRRFMAAAPDAWDYSSSDIPSPLTDELEAAQQSKKADKRARQRAKEKDRSARDGKPAATAGAASSKGTAAAAAGGGDGVDSFDDELAAAMAEAAAISSRASASSKPKQVGGGGGSSGGRRGAAGPSTSAAAAGRPPSAEEVARRREQLAAAAESRLKALQQKQQLW